MLLKFAVKDFLDDRAFRNVSAKTLENYKRTLDEFHAYCVENSIVNVGDVRPATVKSYLVLCQRERGNAPSSLNHKLQNLRVFFNYMEQVELVDARTNPTKAVKPVKAPAKVDVFTDQQIKEMLGYFGRIKGRDKTLYAYRDYAMVVVLLGTGMRLGELVNLRWPDVDFLNQVVTVVGKKRQQSSIPMTAKLRKELSEYRVFVDETFKRRPEYVFTDRGGTKMTDNGVKCIFKRLKEVMNFDGVRLSPHTFRHTFASRMVKAGADAFTVQKMLRHTALTMTMRYVNLFARVSFGRTNPYYGLFLQRLKARNIAQFNVEIIVDKDRISVNKNAVELNAESIVHLVTLAGDYLLLSPKGAL